MAIPAAQLGTVERVERLCAAPSDPTTLRVEVLGEIRKVVDFDAHVWLLTDPATGVGSAPLADVPCLPELPEAIRLKYLTDVNRWTRLAGASTPVGTLRLATGDEPARSLMWRGILERYDIGDVASAAFADRSGIWGFLDLWRTRTTPPFGTGDVALLASLCATLTTAMRALQAETLTAPAVPAPRDLGPVVFLLDDGLRVTNETPASKEWLEILLPATGGAPVPASVYNVAAQLLAVENGIDDRPATARVHLSDGFWVTLRAARLMRADGGSGPTIAVTIEETSPVDRLELFGRVFGLSARENELVGLLATGSDTRDLARRMLLAENTIQDHLKAIFAKTSTRNRRTLLSRALGVRGT